MEDGEDGVLLLKSFLEDFNKKRGSDMEEDFIQFRLMNSFVPEEDFEGEITDWALQYLYQHKCPYVIAGAIVRAVVDVLKVCDLQNYYHQNGDKNKQSVMFDSSKLMQAVHTRVQETCEQWFQSGKFQFQFNPQMVSVCAVKNSRRRMEDRHVVIPDLNQFFGFQDQEPQSFYAVFDGHAGADAAIYAAAHLHHNIVRHPSFRDDIETAMKEGFKHTDERFIAKSSREGLKSGTTVVCAIVRQRSIHVAWLGDSQAILICQGKPLTVMMPHKPDRDDERNRIERLGGCVVYYGTWRVNGTLAVSRAIGDAEYKPYVSGEPDISSIELTGNEDFLLLACDGMWDVLTPEDASYIIYSHLIQSKDDAEGISQKLVQTAKERGSSDNITVLVIFLKSVAEIIKNGMPVSPPTQTCSISRPSFPEGIIENGESPTKITAPDFTSALPLAQNAVKLPEYYENTNPFMESSNPFSSPTNPFTSEPEFKVAPFEIEQSSLRDNTEVLSEPSAPQLSPTEMTSRLIMLPPEGIEDTEVSPRSPATPPITKTPDKLAAFLDSAPNPMHSQPALLDLSSEVTEMTSEVIDDKMQFPYDTDVIIPKPVPSETNLLQLSTEEKSMASGVDESLFNPFPCNVENTEGNTVVEGNVWNDPLSAGNTQTVSVEISESEFKTQHFEYSEKTNESEVQPDLVSLEPVTVETIPETTPVAEDVVDDESEDGDGWRYYSASPTEDAKNSTAVKEEITSGNLGEELKTGPTDKEHEKPKENIVEVALEESLIPALVSVGDEKVSNLVEESIKDNTNNQELVLNSPNEDKTVCMEISDHENVTSIMQTEFPSGLIEPIEAEQISISSQNEFPDFTSPLNVERSAEIPTSTPQKFLSSDELAAFTKLDILNTEDKSFTETPENSFSVSLSQDLNVEVVQEKTSFVSVTYETNLDVPKEFVISEDTPEATNSNANLEVVKDVVISEVTPVTNASSEAVKSLPDTDAKTAVKPTDAKPEAKAEIKAKPTGKQPIKKVPPGTKTSLAPKSRMTVTETSTLKSRSATTKPSTTKTLDRKPVPKTGVPAANVKPTASSKPTTTAKLKSDATPEVSKSSASTTRRNVLTSTRAITKKEVPGPSKDPVAKKPATTTSATTTKPLTRPSSAPNRSLVSKSLERKPPNSNVTERKTFQVRSANKTAPTPSGSTRPATTSEISKTKQTKDTLNKNLSTTVKQISRTTTVSRTVKQSSREGSGSLVKTSTSTVTKSTAGSISRESSNPAANKSSTMPKSSPPKTGTVKKPLNSSSNLKSTSKTTGPTSRSPLTKEKVVTKSPAKQVNKPVTNSEKGALDEKTKELCPLNGDANVEVGPAEHVAGDVVINGFSGAASPISSDTVEQGSGDVATLLTEPSA